MLRTLRHSTSAWMLLGACAWSAQAAPPGDPFAEPNLFPLPLSVERLEERRESPFSVIAASYPADGSIREPGLPVRPPVTGLAQSPAPARVFTDREAPRTASLPAPQPTYLAPQQPAVGPQPQYMLVPVLVQPNGTVVPQMAVPQQAAPQQPVFQPASPQRPVDQPRELRAADEQVRRLARRAAGLAERQALFAAKKEFEQALRTAAQALDAPAGDDLHLRALTAAFTAFDEAEDFAPRQQTADDDLTVAELVHSHRTPILHGTDLRRTNSLTALQAYYQYAQQQLTIGVGGLPASAEALFGLGKVQTLLGGENSSTPQMHTARAIVFHQSALAIDRSHAQAANELGVLLARSGDWKEAKEVLLASLRVRPEPTTWRNLARVHERLGEVDLARRAEFERGKLIGDSGDNNFGVQWVDQSAFARMSPPPMNAPPMNAAPATARNPAQPSAPAWTPPAPVRR